MKSNTKSFFVKFTLILLAIISLCVCSMIVSTTKTETAYAATTIDDFKGSTNCDYVLTNYQVDIVVNENNTYDIEEHITAYFNTTGKHGIYRKIPVYNCLQREDSSKSEYIAKITNIYCNTTHSIEQSVDYVAITIGDENVTLRPYSSVDYVISYTFDAGVDLLENGDEFYFNLIGTEWDAPIGNVSFSIKLPKTFDTSKIGFTHGEYGYAETDGISYLVNGNTITGSYSGVLLKYQGLTTRITFEEGYFNRENKISKFQISSIIIPVVATLILFILWYIFAKNKQIVEEITFYPPNNWNSFDIGYYYNGKTQPKDFTSMIIYLASKGYIKIVESETSFSKPITKIEKVKDYDGKNQFEADFMHNLFLQGNSISTKTPNTQFQTFVQSKTREMNRIVNRSKLNNLNIPLTAISLLTSFALLFLAFALPYLEYKLYSSLSAIAFLITFAFIWYGICFAGFKDATTSTKWTIIAFIAVPTIILPYILLDSLHFISFLKQEKIYITSLVLNIIGTVLTFKLASNMKRHTEYGTQYYGKILGFKRFLNTADKERLEMLVAKNPTYFYDILPYTYVLGISNKWIKKFEEISISKPDWYISTRPFSIHNFSTSCNNMSHSFTRSITPHSSGSSGGGSSGGGFSGGGGGGGGGGSW